MTKLNGLSGMSPDEYQEYYNDNKDELSEQKFWGMTEGIDSGESNDIHGVLLDTKLELNELAEEGFEARTIGDGLRIENWDSGLIEFYYEITEDESALYDRLENTIGMTIVSEKFKLLVEEKEITGIQFLPLTNIKNPAGEKVKGYYYMNVIEVLDTDVIDLDTSIYAYDEDDNELNVMAMSIRYKEVKQDIFMVKINEYYNYGIIISERLRKLIVDNGITGFGFDRLRVSAR